MVNDHRTDTHPDGFGAQAGPARHVPPPDAPPPGPAPGGPDEPLGETRMLSFVSPQGVLHRERVRFGADRPGVVRPPAVARRVVFDGWRGIQVRLPQDRAGDHTACTLLEAEISAALTLHRAYSGTAFGRLFPSPVGYDMNAASPFVLYATPRGRPLSSLARGHGVSTRDEQVIEGDLVLAVCLMEAVGLVHRGIVPAAIYWDGHRVQVWDLGSVTRTGLPRVPFGPRPYAPPEERAGRGETDARDALWSVGQVMYHLVTGRQGNPEGPPPGLEAHRLLAQNLGPVFAPLAAGRPTPRQLLALFMRDNGNLVPHGLPDPLEPLRREFDETLRRKRASLTRNAAAPPPYPPGDPYAVPGPYAEHGPYAEAGPYPDAPYPGPGTPSYPDPGGPPPPQPRRGRPRWTYGTTPGTGNPEGRRHP
jgi:hypothetical protein